MNYIAYYRVSTKTQGDSGLGIDAQRSSVQRYVNDGNIISEFMEVESGKNNDRPKLAEAIQVCKDSGSTLLIAKLDRLSRNAAFTFSLMDSKVKFIAVDMPQANELTIGILAVLAQEEAKKISERTGSALGEIKVKIERDGHYVSRKGNIITRLGKPGNLTASGREKSIETRRRAAKDNQNNRRAYAFISLCNNDSLSSIASKLNAGGFRTGRGALYRAVTVKRIIDLYVS